MIGGAGYIGSHMVRVLLDAQYQPVVFDNLSTGHRQLVPEGAVFVEGDLQSPADLASVLKDFQIKAAMHFAASSLVPESMKDPLKYYRNNVGAFLNLLEQMEAHQVRQLIFSSTAAVYGEPEKSPIREDFPLRPVNPYGQSKAMIEKILADVALTRPLAYAVFRYFNAAGAHEGGETGEWHREETHLIPNLLAAVREKKEFTIFGDDYPTPDGTCVRDYIHVQDLCRAHLLALQSLEGSAANETFNLGNGAGYSVKEVLRAVEKITGKEVRTKVCGRRPGDPPQLIADAQKAKRILGWEARENLEAILRSAYHWHENRPEEKAGPEIDLQTGAGRRSA